MKERPILFSAPMVRAILSSTKTQTRRVVKPQPIADAKFSGGYFLQQSKRTKGAQISVDAPYVHLACPYGLPSDRIYVRETFYAFGRWATRFSAKKGRDEWHFVDMTLETGHTYSYVADGAVPALFADKRDGGVIPKWWKRPALFMPSAASRVTLEITEVRVERLQDMSRGDAMAEGCPFPNMAHGNAPCNWYSDLWKSINGLDSWDANPWVWVITFKRLK